MTYLTTTSAHLTIEVARQRITIASSAITPEQAIGLRDFANAALQDHRAAGTLVYDFVCYLCAAPPGQLCRNEDGTRSTPHQARGLVDAMLTRRNAVTYLGVLGHKISVETWDSYRSRGIGPAPDERIGRTPLWAAATIRAWANTHWPPPAAQHPLEEQQ